MRSSHDDCNEDHDDYDDCNEEDCEHEDLNLCHQVIDAVQLDLHLGPSSPEIPRLGLIIGLLMFYHNICSLTYFILLLFIADSFVG